jgi:hypothetical protein
LSGAGILRVAQNDTSNKNKVKGQGQVNNLTLTPRNKMRGVKMGTEKYLSQADLLSLL